ncbi:MAG TPA: LamG-like jellyroll fold domain-containing protein, partial [Verrucomicrobiae bacterium]|nr:LamG-like jellyroll fold domain-containing protein [Verrucomicrobiae bacterium]
SYSTGANLSTLRNTLSTDLRRHRIGFGETGTSGPFPNTALNAILQQQPRTQASWNMTDATLQELVRGYGSAKLYAQHADEPQSQAEIDAINDPNDEVQRYRRNGVPELLTVSWSREGDYIGWQANVDIFAAVEFALIPFTKAREKLNAGKHVWSYVAGIQPNEAPNWLLDYDLINQRIVPWLDYSTGLTGFLYWTPVNWCPGDPWTNAGSATNPCNIDTNRNLDGVFYFPGHKVGAPNAAIPSARLKAIRDGVEDYDYLALLKSLGDPTLAQTLAQTLAPAWDSWNHDPAALLAAREQAAGRILHLSGTSSSSSDAIPPTISAVAVSGLTATSATVTWTTSEAADTQVEYGPTTSYGTVSPLDGARVTSHTVTLTGLNAGTLYHYRVKSRDAAGNLAVAADATFTPAGATPAANLVGYWPFEDGWGTLAADASGTGNPGTLLNGLAWRSGQVGGALAFDGVNDAVVVADSPSLDTLGAAFTVAAWVQGTESDDGVDDDRAILGKGDTGSAFKNTFTFGLDNAKRLTLRIANGSSYNRVYGATSLQPHVWYHVVGTFDGTQLNVYVNGVRDAAPFTTTLSGSLINSGNLVLGRQSAADCASPYNACWKGLLDEVRVYTRALSATEVQALYNEFSF